MQPRRPGGRATALSWFANACPELCHVRGVAGARAGPEAERLVESFGRRTVRTQTEIVESRAGCLHDLEHELPADTPATECGQHVQMPKPPRALTARIRVDVEPAHADQAPIRPGAKENFSRPIEPIRPAIP